MRRSLTLIFSGLFGFGLVAASFISTSPVAAATIAPTTTCNNALGNGGAVCEVTVVNTITPSGGTAVVTVRECQGSAGVPAATCTVTTNSLTAPVTAVTQCNGSINGGGGQLRCSVQVTNNFVGITPPPTVTAATVNQCVGSGESGAIGATIVCDPYPATTTGATITQCNGSGNGGTLVGLICSASGTRSSRLSVRINQCNGSTNGGGTLTVCSARITNNVVGAPGGGASATPPAVGSVGGPRTSLPDARASDLVGSQQIVSIPLMSVGLVLLAMVSLKLAFKPQHSR